MPPHMPAGLIPKVIPAVEPVEAGAALGNVRPFQCEEKKIVDHY